MFAVIDLVLPLFGLIFLGFATAKLVKLPFEGLAWMNYFIIYLALPALFFKLLAKTPVEQFANIGFIAISIFATLAIFVLVFIIAGLLNRGNVAEATIQGFAAAYGNIGYMGPPLAIAAFGPEAGVPVALIFCFENSMHFILAPFLIGLHHGKEKPGLKMASGVLYKIVTHPFILATIAGVFAAFLEVELSGSFEQLLSFLSAAAAPCALFAMGVTAALRPLKKVPIELSYIIPAKLILHPLIVYILMMWLLPDLNQIWLYSAVLLAALPSATNVFVIAQQYDIWQERASSAVVISTLVATLTVTAILYLMLNGLI